MSHTKKMKYKLFIILTVFAAAAFIGCNGGGSGSSEGKEVFDKDTNYAIGMFFGIDLRYSLETDNIIIDIDEIVRGFRDGLSEKNMRFNEERAEELINMAFFALSEKRREQARQTEIEYLKENTRKPGVLITFSGLQYEIIDVGSGPKPTEDDSVLVHYEGLFTNGSFFASSHTYGRPEVFHFDDMPPGWDEGLLLMSPGSKYKFTVPSELAYGEFGLQNQFTGEMIIPPYTTLIFEIELLEINPKEGE